MVVSLSVHKLIPVKIISYILSLSENNQSFSIIAKNLKVYESSLIQMPLLDNGLGQSETSYPYKLLFLFFCTSVHQPVIVSLHFFFL